eukprot:jgi/Chlat1/5165/Chrsp33S05033
MFSREGGNIYGVKYQARCLAAQHAEKRLCRFLLGTLSLREENEQCRIPVSHANVDIAKSNTEEKIMVAQVHLIEARQDRGGGEVGCVGVYRHPRGEVWHLSPSPHDADALATAYSNAGVYSATVWRLPSSTSSDQLQELASLTGHTGRIRTVLWNLHDRANLLSTDNTGIKLWALDTARKSAAVTSSSPEQQKSDRPIYAAAWDPFGPQVAAARNGSVTVWDLKTMTKASSIDHAHSGMSVRDVNFNARRQHLLLTSGDDCKIKVWDLRHTSAPLSELLAHAHWVCRALFNPVHDQLVLSSSTDSSVKLHVVSSMIAASSAAHVASPATSPMSSPVSSPRAGRKPQDRLAHTYDEHEESVYGLAWSSADPFMFASMSYDGRVVVSTVPNNEKHKIVL